MNFKNTLYFIIKINLYIKSLIRGGLYRIYVDSPAIEKFQIDRFNIIWKDAYTNVPFYSEWKTKYNLPDCISSLIELNNWPILTKKELQENTNKLLRLNEKPTGYIKTGGSTGEPLHLPTIKDTETAVSMWLGRATYSIEPGMKTFLIWGHQHLYGKGIKRQINLFIRNIKDWLSNMKRVSAYDLSEGAMRNAFKQYLKFHPEFIIGFSPSILSFVRINVNEKNEQKVYPRAVLCTAGPLTLSEIEEIRLFFNAPVCMEYGSVECGVMAYTEPFNNEYITIWDTHLLQGINDEYGEVKNIVTRLVHCYVPLIRYDIGDYFELDNDGNFNSILRFKSIKGRPSDMVKLKDGTTFFGALIGDCVKQINSIIANQLHVYQNGIRIDIIAIRKLTESDYNLIRSRLNTVIPSLKRQTVIINQVDHISKTIGGKTQLVVLHDSCILE